MCHLVSHKDGTDQAHLRHLVGQMNLKAILRNLDLRNLEIYEALRHNETDRKELEQRLSYVLPLWMCGTLNGRDQLELMINFNRHINLDWLELQGHPELRAKVLAAIGLGKVVQHDYHTRKQRRMSALMGLLSEAYPDIRQDEVQLWCSINSEAALIELCADHGTQDAERQAIVTEYRELTS